LVDYGKGQVTEKLYGTGDSETIIGKALKGRRK
jgi:aryl-alcohol dehydrogenase-like predicted oxidoreductase